MTSSMTSIMDAIEVDITDYGCNTDFNCRGVIHARLNLYMDHPPNTIEVCITSTMYLSLIIGYN